MTEHPTPTPRGPQNGVRGSTDDVTRVAQEVTREQLDALRGHPAGPVRQSAPNVTTRVWHGYQRSWCVKHERWTGLPGWCWHCVVEGEEMK